MTIISLEGIHIHGDHGFHPEEQLMGNDFVLDVSVYVDTEAAAEEDDLGKTVNYETIYRFCEVEMRDTSDLIETLAQGIVARIEGYFEQVKGVRLKLRKLNPPLGGRVEAAAVEINTGLFLLPLQLAIKLLEG
ncbi:MAG TPA: dihydroneopterin aldolase [Flavilitoribacter sp.]|nr:dihydroneopterin aldolase [Flavilitoribacter sp.]